MEHKNIVATIYLKDGMAVRDPKHTDEKQDVLELARLYNDSGIDKIICYDLSSEDEEHEKNILAIREINRNIEIKTCGGGNIKRLEISLCRLCGSHFKRLQAIRDRDLKGSQCPFWSGENAGIPDKCRLSL